MAFNYQQITKRLNYVLGSLNSKKFVLALVLFVANVHI